MYPITKERKEEILLQNRAKDYFLKHILPSMDVYELHKLQCKVSAIMLSSYNHEAKENNHLRNKFI